MTEQRFGLTEGLLIAGVPVAGYWFAFLYELGYCKYFDIPSSFIEIGILNMLVAVVGLAGALTLIYLYVNPLYMLSRGLAAPIRAALFRIKIPFIFLSGYALVVRLSLSHFAIVFSVIFIPLIFLEFIFPLITQRSIQGYLNKLDAQNKIELKLDTLLDVMVKAIGRGVFSFLSLLLGLSFLAYFAGGYHAKTQTDFMIITGTSESVVLKRNGTYFLAARFDRTSKSISTDFTLVSSKQQLFGFKYERIGPLLPEGIK